MEPKRRKKDVSAEFDPLHAFRKDLVLLIFPSLTEFEAREKVQRYSNEKNLYESDLKDLLGNIRFGEIHRLFKKYFDRDKHTSKIHMIDALLQKFYDEYSAFEKREIEGEIINDIQSKRKLQDEFNFLSMNGVILSIDLIREILSHLDRNENILFSVGMICKSFYYHLLSSWDSIFIEKKNVYNVSLLVLKSVRKVTFVERRTKSDCNFNVSEMDYLFSKFQKLEEIEICSTLCRSVDFFRIFKTSMSRNDRNKNVFHNISTLSFLTRKELYKRYGFENCTMHSYVIVTSFENVKASFPLIFPKVRNLNYPFSPYFHVYCSSLESLKLRKFGMWGGLNVLENHTSLRHLTLTRSRYHADSLFPLRNLASLSITIENPNISTFFSPHLNEHHLKLQKVEIVERTSSSSQSRREPGKIKGLFFEDGNNDKNNKVICWFKNLKDMSLSSITRRGFQDIPSFEILFKHVFPAVNRFRLVVSNPPQSSNDPFAKDFTKSMLDYVTLTDRFEVLDLTFVHVDHSKGSTIVQVVWKRLKTRELKILFLSQELKLRRSSRRSGRRGSTTTTSSASRNIILFDTIISDLKKLLAQPKYSKINRIVIVKDPESELTKSKVEIGGSIGPYTLKERYSNRVEIKKPLGHWFDFGQGEVVKMFHHELFLLE